MRKVLYDKMETLVKRYVRYYRDDFYKYDVDYLAKADETKYLWIIRESGTWLCKEEDIAKFSPYTYCYDDPTARYYQVNTNTSVVKKIRDPKVFLSDMLIKHPEWDEVDAAC